MNEILFTAELYPNQGRVRDKRNGINYPLRTLRVFFTLHTFPLFPLPSIDYQLFVVPQD